MNKILSALFAVIFVGFMSPAYAFTVEELPRNNPILLPVPTLVSYNDNLLVTSDNPYVFDDGSEELPMYSKIVVAPDGCSIAYNVWSMGVIYDAIEKSPEGATWGYSGLRVCP